MQDTFLNSYSKLIQSQQNTTGLWLAHGDEPLLSQWVFDALSQNWQQQGYAISRVELTSVKSWQDVLGELNSLSLFDEATAVVVTGNHKPDKTIISELEKLAAAFQSGSNTGSLLWLTTKLDKRAQKAKWFSFFANTGHVIDCNLYDERQRLQVLKVKAQSLGLNLTDEAWQLLMAHTQHHLLSAYQTLWRLSYLFAPELTKVQATLSQHATLNQQATTSATYSNSILLQADDLQAALVSNAQFSVFDLSDAMLAGNIPQVVKIIAQLKSTDEPTPLVLWTIAKDMRLIMQLMDGQDPQAIGVWRSKQTLYQNACRRQTRDSIIDWADILYECDKAVKGVIRQPAWELLLQAALRVSGVNLFEHSSHQSC